MADNYLTYASIKKINKIDKMLDLEYSRAIDTKTEENAEAEKEKKKKKEINRINDQCLIEFEEFKKILEKWKLTQ